MIEHRTIEVIEHRTIEVIEHRTIEVIEHRTIEVIEHRSDRTRRENESSLLYMAETMEMKFHF